MRELGNGFSLYSIDDPQGYTTPVHPQAERRWLYDGEYEYGGATGLGVFADVDFRAENRILNNFLYGNAANVPQEIFRCPTDRGVESAPVDFEPFFISGEGAMKPVWEGTGTSYRLNNHIDFLGQTPFTDYFYGPYLRPKTRVPSASETIILEETITEVAKWNSNTYVTNGWHCKTNRFNVTFVDGHGEIIYLQGQSDLSNNYPNYWVLRGKGWRMDCHPEDPVEDKASP